jgi:hypothetical protein
MPTCISRLITLWYLGHLNLEEDFFVYLAGCFFFVVFFLSKVRQAFCFNSLAAVTITGDRGADLDLCLPLMALAVRFPFHATPAATRDLRL